MVQPGAPDTPGRGPADARQTGQRCRFDTERHPDTRCRLSDKTEFRAAVPAQKKREQWRILPRSLGGRLLPDMVLLRLGLLGFGIPLDFWLRPDGIFPVSRFPGRRILHDRLNPAEHLTASLADSLSQLSNDRDRVEVRNVPEVLGFKIFLWAQAAAGHEGIGDTGGGKLLERQADVQLVQFLDRKSVV